MLPADYILQEWKGVVESAKQQLKGDCPLLIDEVIVEMDNYIKSLEDQVVKLSSGFQNNKE